MARRGGRFGGGRQSSTKVAGVEMPWEFDAGEDPDMLIKGQQPMSGYFPNLRVYRPAPATSQEAALVQTYKSIREVLQDSPYYAVLGESVEKVPGLAPPQTLLSTLDPSDGPSAGSKKSAAQDTAGLIDPFEGGLTTFSHRYKKLTRRIPNLDGREYNLQFFPKELRSMLDASNAKLLEDSEQPGLLFERRRRDLLDDDSDTDGGEDEADEFLSEELDEDFEEDEDDPDDDNDYNAERYFDGGDDDFGDDDGDNDGFM